MKSSSIVIHLILLALLLSACGPKTEEIAVVTVPEIMETESDVALLYGPMQERLLSRCEEIAAVYDSIYQAAEKTVTDDYWAAEVLSQDSIDEIENALYDAGFDVMDTNGEYPAYLMTAERFRNFWSAVQSATDAEQEIITVTESGTLAYRLFTYRDGAAYVYSMSYPMDGSSDGYYEMHEVQDWTLTDKGNFYYRIYPAGDKHYADFTLIRLEAPDRRLYDLTLKYVYAGGYIGTNLYLTDWSEKNWAELSFHDLWEYLYYDTYDQQFWPDGYTYIQDQYCYEIPAAEFENVILSYFKIDLDTLRELAHYNEEGDYYPWRQIETNDYVFLYYYTIEAEVTACHDNGDGTITLTVENLSTDLKTDCLFAHEVIVRPLEDGGFQFVSNQVIYQTEYGLPYCEPRLTWDETK